MKIMHDACVSFIRFYILWQNKSNINLIDVIEQLLHDIFALFVIGEKACRKGEGAVLTCLLPNFPWFIVSMWCERGKHHYIPLINIIITWKPRTNYRFKYIKYWAQYSNRFAKPPPPQCRLKLATHH